MSRRILIHINNSNPILIEGSPEEAKVKAAGWEIAFDGMEVSPMNVHAPSEPMSPEALEAALRAIGPERYHDLHPFHGLLHDGKLNKGQVQAWALNRYVYQAAIPRKDASPDRALRGSRIAPRVAAPRSPTMTASATTRAASSAGSSSPTDWGSTATM